MAEELGPWVEHDGAGVPVAPGTWCQVETKGGLILEDRSHGPLSPGGVSLWIWSDIPRRYWFMAIIRYRIRKPRGLVILETLLADLPAPAPARESEDA